MSATDFKAWMEKNGWRVEDVASELRIHFNTVYKFLSGKRILRSTEDAIQRLSKTSGPPRSHRQTG